MLNDDYRDMLQCLTDEKVKFLHVGAYALAAYGYPRATMDIDIPSVDDLIRNKRASGRSKDLAGAEAVESLRNTAKRDRP